MKRKAQAAIICLWVIVILTILAVAAGHRVAMALRLSRYQKDRIKGYCIAKAGLNLAIAQILKDSTNSDSMQDKWADSKDIFETITLGDNLDDSATVSYVIKEGINETTKFGVIDEERKININTAPAGLIEEALTKAGATGPADIANNICAWRGDTGLTAPDYADLGYSNKGNKISNLEELMLVKGIDQEIYDKLKSLTTVWGSGKVNINTTSKEILDILIQYARKQIQSGESDPLDLSDRIRQLIPAVSSDDLQVKLKAQGDLNAGQSNILTEMAKLTDFKSSCFYIVSNGKIKNNLILAVDCVFDRGNKKIIYWHES